MGSAEVNNKRQTDREICKEGERNMQYNKQEGYSTLVRIFIGHIKQMFILLTEQLGCTSMGVLCVWLLIDKEP